MKQTYAGHGQGLIVGQVLLSEYNSLGDGRYYDTASQTSFEVDHASQVGPLST